MSRLGMHGEPYYTPLAGPGQPARLLTVRSRARRGPVEPQAEPLGGGLRGRAVERHECRRRAAVALNLSPPPVRPHGEHLDDVRPTVDRFLIPMRVQLVVRRAGGVTARTLILLPCRTRASEAAYESAHDPGGRSRFLASRRKKHPRRHLMHRPSTVHPQVFHTSSTWHSR